MQQNAQTVAPLPVTENLASRAARAAEVAATHAASVDMDSRFPVEAMDALKAEKLISEDAPVAQGVALIPAL